MLYRLDQNLVEHVTMLGGTGDDYISSWSYSAGDVRIDAGAGRDQVLIWSTTGSHVVSLGADQDVLDLAHLVPYWIDRSAREVTDFQPAPMATPCSSTNW